MRQLQWFCVFVAGFAVTGLTMATVVAADEKPADAQVATSRASVQVESPEPQEPLAWDEVEDPAFDRYVDLGLLALAWEKLNPALMTDVALQLREGERILARPHKAVRSEQLLGVALRMATQQHDKETLTRLEKALAAGAAEQLQAQLKATKALLADSRGNNVGKVDPDTTSVEAFAQFKALKQELLRARLLNDQQTLEQLRNELALLPLNDTLKQQLTELAKVEGPAELGAVQEDQRLGQVLSLLEQGSRRGGSVRPMGGSTTRPWLDPRTPGGSVPNRPQTRPEPGRPVGPAPSTKTVGEWHGSWRTTIVDPASGWSTDATMTLSVGFNNVVSGTYTYQDDYGLVRGQIQGRLSLNEDTISGQWKEQGQAHSCWGDFMFQLSSGTAFNGMWGYAPDMRGKAGRGGRTIQGTGMRGGRGGSWSGRKSSWGGGSSGWGRR